MPELTVRSAKGESGSSLTLDDAVFGGEANSALLHQAVLRQLADRRQGTHDSQTRAEVSRTTKKVWRQKGTGRARQGSRKGPHWTGGGVVFGPHPRSHRQDLPKKMRAAAIRAALAAKTASGDLSLVDELRMARPSTKELAQLLGSFDGGLGASTLLITDGPQLGVQLSARNLRGVTVATTSNISAYELMRHRRIVLTVAAARRLEARYGAGDESSLPEAETQSEIEVRAARPTVVAKRSASKSAAKGAAKAAGKSAAKASKRAAPDGAPLTDAPVETMPAGQPADEPAKPRRASKTAAKASGDAGDEGEEAPAAKSARKRATKSAAKGEE
jgi:large subunit ribosomal protein L4